MNAQPHPPTPADPAASSAPQTAPPATPRFDRKFIEEHRLIERYLDGKLPYKGARDLENWCRSHPDYLTELRMAERTHASLKLLDASGRPQDLGEPTIPWWKTPYTLIGLGVLTVVSVVGFLVLFGKYALLRGALEDARTQLSQGTLAPPVSQRDLRVAPDRSAGAGGARIAVSHATPELVDLRIDMSYSPESLFKVTVDKRDQGRALVIGGLSKDSNGDIHIAFNTAGLGAGPYDVRIDGLPARAAPVGEGWLIIDAR